MRETWVPSLGREDPLEKEMAIHSSAIAWKIPWTEAPGRLQSMGSKRVGRDWVASLALFIWAACSLFSEMSIWNILHSITQTPSHLPSPIFTNFFLLKWRKVFSIYLRLISPPPCWIPDPRTSSEIFFYPRFRPYPQSLSPLAPISQLVHTMKLLSS